MTDNDLRVHANGIWYLDRDRRDLYRLDGPAKPDIPRPERDVVIALLKYALSRYEEDL